jgi:hypothetical protein
MADRDSREDLERRAESARYSGKDAEGVALYEKIIGRNLAAGQISRAVAVYQKLIAWKPEDIDLHRRVAQAIAYARDGRMPAPEDAAISSYSPFFGDMSKDEVARVLEKMKPHHYPVGANIVVEGDPGKSLFLISEGTVSVWTRDEGGEDVELARLSAGEFFGEVSLLTERPRTATVKAETPVDVLELSRSDVAEVRQQFPNIDRALQEFHRSRAERTVEALIERRRSDA